jgi:hypothetical protein
VTAPPGSGTQIRMLQCMPQRTILFISFMVSTMDQFVITVFGRCAPFQVLYSIVRGVAVEMSAFESSWPQTNECFKNEDMNPVVLPAPIK